MRKVFFAILVAVTLVNIIGSSALAGDDQTAYRPMNRSELREVDDSPPGEFILLDVLVLRPLGLAATAIGVAGAIVSTPLAVATQSEDRVGKSLLRRPYEYTFCRPVGDVDY